MRHSQKKRSVKIKKSTGYFKRYGKRSFTQSDQSSENYKGRQSKIKQSPASGAGNNSTGLGTSTTEAQLIGPSLGTTSPLQRLIIREMVATYLKQHDWPEPVELAPLDFIIMDSRAQAADINPFLIAMEFALQGKTIQIQQSALSYQIKDALIRYGVPSDRIIIFEQNSGIKASNVKLTRVRLTAL